VKISSGTRLSADPWLICVDTGGNIPECLDRIKPIAHFACIDPR